MNYKRCVVCNKVSNNDIATNQGDYTADVFFIDETSGGNICWECDSWDDNLRQDYQLKDLEDEINLEEHEGELFFPMVLEADTLEIKADNDNDE
jgi:hypothetical protein